MMNENGTGNFNSTFQFPTKTKMTHMSRRNIDMTSTSTISSMSKSTAKSNQSWKWDQTVPVMVNAQASTGSFQVSKICIDQEQHCVHEHEDPYQDPEQETLTIQISLQKTNPKSKLNMTMTKATPTPTSNSSNSDSDNNNVSEAENFFDSPTRYYDDDYREKGTGKIRIKTPTINSISPPLSFFPSPLPLVSTSTSTPNSYLAGRKRARLNSCACAREGSSGFGLGLYPLLETVPNAETSFSMVLELQKKVISQAAVIREFEIQNKVINHFLKNKNVEAQEQQQQKIIKGKPWPRVKDDIQEGQGQGQGIQKLKIGSKPNAKEDKDKVDKANGTDLKLKLPPRLLKSCKMPLTSSTSPSPLNKTFTLTPEKRVLKSSNVVTGNQTKATGGLNTTFTVSGSSKANAKK